MRRRALGVLLVVGALLVPLGAAYASHQFTDVPDSHTFHNAIDWMKDNNITVGCNPPANTRYCPDDNVTRGQMAAFMKRLAENRVVDANTLDGKDSLAFQSVVATSTGSQAHGTGLGSPAAGPPFVAASVTINGPLDGIIKIFGSTGWELGTMWYTQWLEIDEATPCDSWNSTDRLPGSGTEENADSSGASLNSQAVVPGPSGAHTVSLCLWPFGGTPSLNVDYSLIAEWQATSAATLATTGDIAGDQSAPEGGPSSD